MERRRSTQRRYDHQQQHPGAGQWAVGVTALPGRYDDRLALKSEGTVFAKWSDSGLNVKSSGDGSSWTDWTNYGGILTAAPAAASYRQADGTDLLYTFANRLDNTLYERHTSDGATWTDWQGLGGELVGPPAAAGVNGQLYAFVWWRDNTLWERHTLP